MKIIKIVFTDPDFKYFPTVSINYSGCTIKELRSILKGLPDKAVINKITIVDEDKNE